MHWIPLNACALEVGQHKVIDLDPLLLCPEESISYFWSAFDNALDFLERGNHREIFGDPW